VIELAQLRTITIYKQDVRLGNHHSLVDVWGLPRTNNNIDYMAFFLLTYAKTMKQHQGINHMMNYASSMGQPSPNSS
jgi:hypothetical protein